MATSYPTDLTDAQWEVVSTYFVKAAGTHGRPPKPPTRSVVEAVPYVVGTGCQWRALPQDFPDYRSVIYYFAKWRDNGTWQEALDAMNQLARKKGPQTIPCRIAVRCLQREKRLWWRGNWFRRRQESARPEALTGDRYVRAALGSG